MKLKIKIVDAVKILKTKKEFLIYQSNENNKLTDYVITNDLNRYKKEFGICTQFTLIEKIKPQIKYLTINI